MFRRLRSLLVGFCVLALFAQPAMASALATVTSITGSAVVMRGNKVEKLHVGARIEKGDRVLVASGGRVTLSGGTVLGPGTSAVAKGGSAGLKVTTTSSASKSKSTSNSSKLFSRKKGYGKDDDRKDEDDEGDEDEDEDDNDDEDEDDKDEDDDEYGNPKDTNAVSL